ncbi:EamA family transporter [Legionella sp. km772]|uniref:EamA family transporter n=1 Tax=Legionella sp. km772 TaxID=2498111 RepID=UPI000F8DAC2E|nr:EamA family transporter [Legionella sp. km772]RUR07218.1 O-acetylserine/cysteine exporter [Legionella sp. km772]
MPIRHFLLVLLVILVWGINFIFVKLGLQEISPLLLCALRFLLASVPAVFFVKPPKASILMIAAYGFFMFALQFSLVFMGMYVGMTPGMASLIMQVQVFFSMFFAVLWFGEQPQLKQIVGALVAFAGIAVVALHFDQHVSLWGFLCILGAAASWGIGNLIAKKIDTSNLIAVIVWGSFIICLPMFAAALVIEGPQSFLNSYQHLSWKGFGSLLYIVYASTWVGYGVWNWLLGRYPVSVVVPFTLLIPLVGIISSVLVFGEPFQLWKLLACLLVITGLCINLFSARLFRLKLRSEAA